MMTQIYILTK